MQQQLSTRPPIQPLGYHQASSLKQQNQQIIKGFPHQNIGINNTLQQQQQKVSSLSQQIQNQLTMQAHNSQQMSKINQPYVNQQQNYLQKSNSQGFIQGGQYGQPALASNFIQGTSNAINQQFINNQYSQQASMQNQKIIQSNNNSNGNIYQASQQQQQQNQYHASQVTKQLDKKLNLQQGSGQHAGIQTMNQQVLPITHQNPAVISQQQLLEQNKVQQNKVNNQVITVNTNSSLNAGSSFYSNYVQDQQNYQIPQYNQYTGQYLIKDPVESQAIKSSSSLSSQQLPYENLPTAVFPVISKNSNQQIVSRIQSGTLNDSQFSHNMQNSVSIFQDQQIKANLQQVINDSNQGKECIAVISNPQSMNLNDFKAASLSSLPRVNSAVNSMTEIQRVEEIFNNQKQLINEIISNTQNQNNSQQNEGQFSFHQNKTAEINQKISADPLDYLSPAVRELMENMKQYNQQIQQNATNNIEKTQIEMDSSQKINEQSQRDSIFSPINIIYQNQNGHQISEQGKYDTDQIKLDKQQNKLLEKIDEEKSNLNSHRDYHQGSMLQNLTDQTSYFNSRSQSQPSAIPSNQHIQINSNNFIQENQNQTEVVKSEEYQQNNVLIQDNIQQMKIQDIPDQSKNSYNDTQKNVDVQKIIEYYKNQNVKLETINEENNTDIFQSYYSQNQFKSPHSQLSSEKPKLNEIQTTLISQKDGIPPYIESVEVEKESLNEMIQRYQNRLDSKLNQLSSHQNLIKAEKNEDQITNNQFIQGAYQNNIYYQDHNQQTSDSQNNLNTGLKAQYYDNDLKNFEIRQKQEEYDNQQQETQQFNQKSQSQQQLIQDNYTSNIQQLIYQKTDEIKNQIDSLSMNTLNALVQKEQNSQISQQHAIQDSQDLKNKDFISANDYSIQQNTKFGKVSHTKIQFEDGLAISTINPTESYINDTKYFNQNLTDAQEELLKTQQTQESNVQNTDTYMITRTEENESVKKSMKKVEQIVGSMQNTNSMQGDNVAYNFQREQDYIKINDFNDLIKQNESPAREKQEEKVLDRINQLLKQHKERSSSVASSVSSTPQQKVIEGVTLEDIENLIDKKMGQLVEKLRIKKFKRKTSDVQEKIKKKEGEGSFKNRKSQDISEINVRKSSANSSTARQNAEEIEDSNNENFTQLNEKQQKQIKKSAPRNINTSQEQLVITISTQQQQSQQQLKNKPISLSEIEINKFGSNQDMHRLPTEEEELINLYSQKTVYTSQIDQQELKNNNNSDLYQNPASNNTNKIDLNTVMDNHNEDEQEEVTVNDASPTKTINSSPRNNTQSSSEQFASQQDEFYITVETEENQDDFSKQNQQINQQEDQKLKAQKVLNNYVIEEKEEDETPQNSGQKDSKLTFNLKSSFNEINLQNNSNSQSQHPQQQVQLENQQQLGQQQQSQQQQLQQQGAEMKINKQIQKILKVEKQNSPSKFQNMGFGEKAQKIIQRGNKSARAQLSSSSNNNNNQKSEKNLNVITISSEELKTPKSQGEKVSQTVRSLQTEGNQQEKKVKIQEQQARIIVEDRIPPKEKKELKVTKMSSSQKQLAQIPQKTQVGKIQIIQIQQQQQQQQNKLQKTNSAQSLHQKDQLQKILNQKKSLLQQQINEIENQIQNLQEEEDNKQVDRKIQQVQSANKINANKTPLLISPVQNKQQRYHSPQAQYNARSKSQEKLHIDIQQISKSKQQGKQMDNDSKVSKSSKSKTRGEYLYEIAILQNERKKILQEISKKSETQRQYSECTFSPKIKQTHNQFHQLSFTERQQIWQKKKLEKTKSLVSNFSSDDIKDCTFRPELLKRLDTNKDEYFIQEFQKQIQKLNAKKLIRQMNSSSPKSRISNKNLSGSKISGSQMMNNSSQSSTIFQQMINSKGSSQQKFHKISQDSVINSAKQSNSKYYQQQTGYQISNSYKRNQYSHKSQKVNKTQETISSNKTELELIQEYQRLISNLQSKAPVPIQLQKKDEIFTLEQFQIRNNQFTNSQDEFQDEDYQQFNYAEPEQIAKSNRTQQSFNKTHLNPQFN
ncbi:hypothetical protein TTHERM_00526430 (macronuclear) [Tetrahymena thermophila SB210]|uniref:Uncharacterized protein n=1 Tax=Tetrahymena thermophila (strain SB210) TaxID=312017 RepID=I7MN32_TETTS|nr:hypothetical protein TTHERM_00526430 [Tetrahymena thermophila SB210]EAS07812.2 hypothetical protein TTHERM_00526430 [Tetrahymena thermophila SB210]|eukprot:XP_001028054.2 hypothetical protein TTHERM_00526430 [Tetrahymena thermophila SB210]